MLVNELTNLQVSVGLAPTLPINNELLMLKFRGSDRPISYSKIVFKTGFVLRRTYLAWNFTLASCMELLHSNWLLLHSLIALPISLFLNTFNGTRQTGAKIQKEKSLVVTRIRTLDLPSIGKIVLHWRRPHGTSTYHRSCLLMEIPGPLLLNPWSRGNWCAEHHQPLMS